MVRRRSVDTPLSAPASHPTPPVGITFKSPSDFPSITRFAAKLEALAGLPHPEQLREILALSQAHRIPTVWERTRYSALENEAIYLVTTMAFSSQKRWPGIVRGFFNRLGLKVDRRGRPWKHPQEVTDIVRGPRVDKLVRLFKKVLTLKNKKGLAIREDDLVAELKKRKLDDLPIEIVLKTNSPIDAASRYYHEKHEPMASVKAIKNSYTRYLKVAHPSRTTMSRL